MNVFDRLLDLNPTWRDAADVLIVAVIIYWILSLIRGTRAMQISIGLMLLTSTFFVSSALDLPALGAISGQILFYLPFAVIVLFQQEIRRALAAMVANPLTMLWRPRNGALPVDAVVDACGILSKRRTGALIAIEGRQTLRAWEEAARPIDAILSAELLVAVFTPGGPLHDGAVIIRGGRIAAASAFLPLTSSADPLLSHGTRHRAAIGLSEESDALVIVVSEENGSIAVASEGELIEDVQRERLESLIRVKLGVKR